MAPAYLFEEALDLAILDGYLQGQLAPEARLLNLTQEGLQASHDLTLSSVPAFGPLGVGEGSIHHFTLRPVSSK
ncbi:MAG TPA: hypothetical protein VEI97_06175 [bacterium]|nr:hypothetical protein [bacterium]